MPFDITPLHRASAIRPQASTSVPPLPPRSAKLDQADGGVTVETSGELLSAAPPVNEGRVQEIRRALEEGTYPVVPTQIADAMIAARLMLSTTK
jgi:negative regulator of flagellin synthesis FlgM